MKPGTKVTVTLEGVVIPRSNEMIEKWPNCVLVQTHGYNLHLPKEYVGVAPLYEPQANYTVIRFSTWLGDWRVYERHTRRWWKPGSDEPHYWQDFINDINPETFEILWTPND